MSTSECLVRGRGCIAKSETLSMEGHTRRAAPFGVGFSLAFRRHAAAGNADVEANSNIEYKPCRALACGFVLFRHECDMREGFGRSFRASFPRALLPLKMLRNKFQIPAAMVNGYLCTAV